MEIRKNITTADGIEREYIFFKVKYNHFRDVGDSDEHAVRDREEWAEVECALALPKTYTADGEETPLILSFHGAGSRVCEAEDMPGGVRYVTGCIDAGYAALDVCGSEPHGTTMGCAEHIFAAYKAYRYAIKHYNLSEKVLVAGASMGGHVAMNFANTFPSLVLAVGMFYPRLNIDGVTVGDHYCIGTWDKALKKIADGKQDKNNIVEIYRFPDDNWCELNTIGFNPHKSRSFINSDGERVVFPPCPIKIWQGDADTTVDPVMVQEYVNSVRRGGCYIELHMLHGVAHKISPVMRQELTMWFNRFI